MKAPIYPQQIFNNFLYLNLADMKCLEVTTESQLTLNLSKKETLKKQIKDMLREKAQYLNLLEQKQKLKTTLQQLLNYRQSIDYDHKYKRLKFEHYQFPYRDNTIIKQDLYKQRLLNLDKRKRVKELEEEIKVQQRAIEAKRREKQNLNIWKIGNLRQDDCNRDCDEDYWLRRIQKMKDLYLNRQEEWKRTRIKHDYNLLVERSNCCCTKINTCQVCSQLNRFESTHKLMKGTQGYAKEALLSPRYASLYRNNHLS